MAALTVTRWTGWYRPNPRSAWRAVCHADSEGVALDKLLSATRGDKIVLPALDPSSKYSKYSKSNPRGNSEYFEYFESASERGTGAGPSFAGKTRLFTQRAGTRKKRPWKKAKREL